MIHHQHTSPNVLSAGCRGRRISAPGSPVHTGWAWTHPTMSVLLRRAPSDAMVVNDPGQFEPFDHNKPRPIKYRGLCPGGRVSMRATCGC